MYSSGVFGAGKSTISKILFRNNNKHVAQFTFHNFQVIAPQTSWILYVNVFFRMTCA